MNMTLKYVILGIVCVVCFVGTVSDSVQAKMIEPDLKRKEADYYIIKEATLQKPGEVSAKLQNKKTEIIIPESLEIKGKKYIVTKVSGLCYPDTLDSSLKQDSYKCKKNMKTTKIVLPKTINTIQKGTFSNFDKLKKIEINQHNKNYKVINGSVLSKDGKTLYGTVTLKGTYKVPQGVKIIASRAFAYSNVKKVILSKECSVIKERAFYCCVKLKKIQNIQNLKRVDKGAFYNTKVKKIRIMN